MVRTEKLFSAGLLTSNSKTQRDGQNITRRFARTAVTQIRRQRQLIKQVP